MENTKVKSGKTMSLIKLLGVGESFYTTATQNYVQSYATKFKIRVSTEAVLIVEEYGSNPKTLRATKVIILPPKEQNDN